MNRPFLQVGVSAYYRVGATARELVARAERLQDMAPQVWWRRHWATGGDSRIRVSMTRYSFDRYERRRRFFLMDVQENLCWDRVWSTTRCDLPVDDFPDYLTFDLPRPRVVDETMVRVLSVLVQRELLLPHCGFLTLGAPRGYL